MALETDPFAGHISGQLKRPRSARLLRQFIVTAIMGDNGKTGQRIAHGTQESDYRAIQLEAHGAGRRPIIHCLHLGYIADAVFPRRGERWVQDAFDAIDHILRGKGRAMMKLHP